MLKRHTTHEYLDREKTNEFHETALGHRSV